jgi:hypothetical protein
MKITKRGKMNVLQPDDNKVIMNEDKTTYFNEVMCLDKYVDTFIEVDKQEALDIVAKLEAEQQAQQEAEQSQSDEQPSQPDTQQS